MRESLPTGTVPSARIDWLALGRVSPFSILTVKVLSTNSVLLVHLADLPSSAAPVEAIPASAAILQSLLMLTEGLLVVCCSASILHRMERNTWYEGTMEENLKGVI